MNSLNPVTALKLISNIDLDAYIQSIEMDVDKHCGILKLTNGKTYSVEVLHIDEATLINFELEDWRYVAKKAVEIIAKKEFFTQAEEYQKFSGAYVNDAGVEETRTGRLIKHTEIEDTTNDYKEVIHYIERKQSLSVSNSVPDFEASSANIPTEGIDTTNLLMSLPETTIPIEARQKLKGIIDTWNEMEVNHIKEQCRSLGINTRPIMQQQIDKTIDHEFYIKKLAKTAKDLLLEQIDDQKQVQLFAKINDEEVEALIKEYLSATLVQAQRQHITEAIKEKMKRGEIADEQLRTELQREYAITSNDEELNHGMRKLLSDRVLKEHIEAIKKEQQGWPSFLYSALWSKPYNRLLNALHTTP